MKRGDLYRVRHPSGDPRPARVFAVVSRQALLDLGRSSCRREKLLAQYPQAQ